MIASQHSFISSVASVTAAAGSRKNLYFAVGLVNMLALCTGIPIAFTSPILPKLLDKDALKYNPLGRVITKEEASLIGSLISVGGFFGTYLAGLSSAKVGRKKSLLFSCIVPFIVAFLVLAHAKTIVSFFIGRILSGIAVSGVYTVIPLYNGEIAENSNRGLICCSMVTFQTTGQIFTYGVAPYLTIFSFCMLSVSIALITTALIIICLPESPYYLISIEDRRGAEKALTMLRSNFGREIVNELNFIQMVLDECKAEQGRVLDIFKTKPMRRAQAISVALTVFQNLSGITAILFYSELIFQETGTHIPPQVGALAIGFIQFLASFVAPISVDRFGRRWMLFVSAIGMCISEVHLGLYFFLKDNKYDIRAFYWAPLVCLISYMIFYSMGYGPLVWTVMAEIFPNNLKSPAATVTVACSWALAFIVTLYFQPAAETVGMAACFWFFAGSCFVAAIFSVTVLFETKGKSFQEIQELLHK